MSKRKIFISYRRDDIPGYVARLEDELEKVFGEYSVFRDVEDIAGGTEWKRAIDHNLKLSAALILVIGPHWSRLWTERQNDPVNYIAWELERARELGLTIIPVTIHGGDLPPDTDLGEVSWLRDKQFYDISDRQNRWRYDLEGLIALLDRIPGLDRKGQHHPGIKQPVNKPKPWLWYATALVLAVLGLSLLIPLTPEEPVQDPRLKGNLDLLEKNGLLVANDKDATTQTGIAISDKAVSASEPTEVAVVTTKPTKAKPVSTPKYSYEIPDISGTWVSSLDDTVYHVTPLAKGQFAISSPGYASGNVEFIKNMPRKFKVIMHGVGHGEYAVSNTDDTAMGWFIDERSGEKVYEKMTRIP